MKLRTLTNLGLAVFIFGMASAIASTTEPGDLTLERLKKMTEHELNRLFVDAPPGEIPVGYGRGKVLLLTESKKPRLRARLAGSVWKGKVFDEDGSFINQWLGFKALRSHAEYGTSWHDGKPCIVIEYPLNTPLFGKSRDEIREIAPGLYLALLYERCPHPRFRGYFAFQIECGKHFKH